MGTEGDCRDRSEWQAPALILSWLPTHLCRWVQRRVRPGAHSSPRMCHSCASSWPPPSSRRVECWRVLALPDLCSSWVRHPLHCWEWLSVDTQCRLLGPGAGAPRVAPSFCSPGQPGVGAACPGLFALSPQPCQFERCVLLSLQSLRGVLESKPGEPSVSVGEQPRAGGPAHGFGSLQHQNCRPVTQAWGRLSVCIPLSIGLPTLDALVHMFPVHIKLHEQKVFLAKYKNSHCSLQVFQHPKTQEEVCQLSINIMQVLCRSSGDLRQCWAPVSWLFNRYRADANNHMCPFSFCVSA